MRLRKLWTPEEEAVAKARLAERAEGGTPAAVPAEPPSAAQTPSKTPLAEAGGSARSGAPKRLLLADLREAGRRRRR